MKPDKFYFEKAAEQARQATCHRAKCGSVIVANDGAIIGVGYNAPPLNDERQRHCETEFNLHIKPKYDKTCCVHAEWNAILNALRNNADQVPGSTLYFMRVDDRDQWTDAGKPFCTVCSRLAMQSGLKKFALWSDNKTQPYDVDEYNIESYNYYKKDQP